MYTYYTLMSAGYKIPRSLAKYVTSIQLIQMFLGVFVSTSVYVTKHYLWVILTDSFKQLI